MKSTSAADRAVKKTPRNANESFRLRTEATQSVALHPSTMLGSSACGLASWECRLAVFYESNVLGLAQARWRNRCASHRKAKTLRSRRRSTESSRMKAHGRQHHATGQRRNLKSLVVTTVCELLPFCTRQTGKSLWPKPRRSLRRRARAVSHGRSR